VECTCQPAIPASSAADKDPHKPSFENKRPPRWTALPAPVAAVGGAAVGGPATVAAVADKGDNACAIFNLSAGGTWSPRAASSS
jgi:hypothetical protein